ncbi:MAG TPA: class I SAM-dependent methyltransferase [Steroidobacteraceae bacterium]
MELRKTAGAAPNFDRLAGIYPWMEALSFGPLLWWCRCSFLGEMRTAKRAALVLGDGDGRFTARLLRENPLVRVDAMDVSPAMLAALLRRAGQNADRVTVEVADVRSWPPLTDRSYEPFAREPGKRETGAGSAVIGPEYDLVVTHFLLDCLTTDEVEALAARVRPLLADDAVWVVSEFAVPAGRFGRWVARPIVSILYCAFGWMTGLSVQQLPDHVSALERAGFRLRRRHKWLGGLLVSECWALRFRRTPDSRLIMRGSTLATRGRGFCRPAGIQAVTVRGFDS